MSNRRTRLADWLDHRTGARKLIHEALYEPVPGGARWRYVWGSTLVMAFATQVITGVFLWMFYSPSTTTAWESVYYIQHEVTGGWLLRGVHHFMASAMVVLLALHFVQVVWDGAYRAPRELNFVLGIVLMLIVLGLALTGYLLPWDQKGYWATNVGTNLASQAPVVGPEMKKLAIGGSDYGHQTLTRFFALHAGVLPGALVAFLVLHIAVFRRHGLHAKNPDAAPTGMFWPDQILKDSVAALAVLAAVLGLTVYYGGAELTAPADPANPYDAARPEWYFLFLFQFLKWFPGESEVWGAFIIPGALVAAMFAMPWIGRTRAGHVFNVALLAVLMGGAALLTAQAINDDYFAQGRTIKDVNPMDSAAVARWQASRRFLDAKEQAELEAERVIELAGGPERIPPTGALTLMYDDAYLQGPKLFKQHCAGCHDYQSPIGAPPEVAALSIANREPSAPNLFGLGSVEWMQGWLDAERIASPHYYGYADSPFAEGDMASYVQDEFSEDLDEGQRAAAREAFAKVAAALAAEADLPPAACVAPNAETVAEGRELLAGGLADVLDSGMSCTDCHKFHDDGDLGYGPDLTGYMSHEWLIAFIKNPEDERFYPDSNDRMPAFAAHDDPRMNQLDDKSIELIVDWLRGDWQRPAEVESAE